MNYGLLLLLNNENQRAAQWLQFASELQARPKYWDAKTRKIGYEAGPGMKLLKPTKDDELRIKVIDSSRAKLHSQQTSFGQQS